MKRDGKVISFINMKGGVGKTTLCIELADQISNKQRPDGVNYKILLIDIDPQANLTQAVNEHYYPDDDIPNKSIELLFTSKPTGFKADDIIVNLPNENLDIIPGELETIFLERASHNSTSQKLMDFIIDKKIKELYDFIIVDCPPTYSIYTEMAFFVSDYYFIPVIPDKYSLLGVDLLERVVTDIISSNRNSIFKDKVPHNLGVIFTRVDLTGKPKQEHYINALKSSGIIQEKNIYIFSEHFKESNKLSTFDLGRQVSDTQDGRLKLMMDNISDDFLKRIDALKALTMNGAEIIE